MNGASKYEFDLSFDTRPGGLKADDDADGGNQILSLSEEDVVALKTMAHAEGFAEGRDAALKSIEKSQEDLLAEISQSLKSLVEAFEVGEQARIAEAGRLTLALASKFLPPLVAATSEVLLEGTIRATLAEAESQPRLVVRVADAMLDKLEQKVSRFANESGFTGKILLLADPGMTGADCRIEWAEGGVERCEQRLWQSIERIVNENANAITSNNQATGNPETDI